MSELDRRLSLWREVTEHAPLPSGLLARLKQRARSTGFEAASDDEIGDALERGLFPASSVEAPGVESSPGPAPDWYVAIEDRQLGPMTVQRVRELWSSGDVSLETLCWRPGFSDWVPIESVSELAMLRVPKESTPQPLPPVTDLSSLANAEMAVLVRVAEEPPLALQLEPPMIWRPSIPLERPSRSRRVLYASALAAMVTLAAVGGSRWFRSTPVVSSRVVGNVLPTAVPAPTSTNPEPALHEAAMLPMPPPPVLVNEEEPSRKRRVHRDAARSTEVASVDPAESSKPKSDDDFGSIFGGDQDEQRSAPKRKGAGYIPPEPGAAHPVSDILTQGDIMGVVVSHKAEIGECVRANRSGTGGGRMVIRWTILPSGKTANISVRTPEFASTPLARCLTDHVKAWAFPKHHTQGEPIDFPFTF